MKITSYLVFNGRAEEAAHFYAGLLGGKLENLWRFNQMPPDAGFPPIPEGDGEKIMHCCIFFPGGSMALADTLPSDKRDFGNGGHMLTLVCDSIEQAETTFAKLSDGAQKIPCAMQEVFYAKRYGEVIDRFGVLWGIMFEG